MHSMSRSMRPPRKRGSDGSRSADQPAGIGWPAVPPDRAAPGATEGRTARKAERRVRSGADGSRESCHTRRILGRPVPRTDTRGLAEHAKASERTVVKELCKIAPQASDKERSRE